MVDIQTDRHMFVSGKTRSGKTVLVQSFLNTLPKVIIHDQKGEWDMFAVRNHYYIVHTPEELYNLLTKGASRIIYQPPPGDEDAEGFNDFCEVVFHQTNLTLVVDEAASYCPTGKVPKWASALLRLGNGLGMGVISLTQRPRDVANVLLSESVVIVSYRLALKTDRSKIIETVGTEIEGISLGEWRNRIGTNVDPKLDPAGSVLVNTVLRTLPRFHFLIYSSDTEEIHVSAPVPYRG